MSISLLLLASDTFTVFTQSLIEIDAVISRIS